MQSRKELCIVKELATMENEKVLKELRQIRNILIALALKSGATSEDIGTITGMGGSNVRALFLTRKKRSRDSN